MTRLAMIGIDTNVLLRLLVRDHDAQVRAAERFIVTHCSKADPGFVSRIVIAEIAWALKRFYGYERREIAAAIRALLNVAEFEIESADEMHAAIADFEGSSAGFADCLLARTNASTGCDYTITFDRKAAKLTGFKLLTDA
jgi:predicted nucleic-acid-binding protein